MTIGYIKLRTIKQTLFIYLLFLFITPSSAFPEEKYVFERMWPTLQQPWYFHEIRGMAMDQQGNILIADYLKHRVEKYTPNGQLITQWGYGDLQNPISIAVDKEGYIYVVDVKGLEKFSPEGESLIKIKLEDITHDIAINKEGDFFLTTVDYVSGSWVYKVKKLASDGTLITEWDGTETNDGQFHSLTGLAVDNEGFVYVADSNGNSIYKFDTEGNYITEWSVLHPFDISIDGEENIWVSTSDSVYTFTPGGELLSFFPNVSSYITLSSILIDKENQIVYCGGFSSTGVLKFTFDMTPITSWRSFGQKNGEFSRSTDAAIDSQGNIYISDGYRNHKIHKFGPDGKFVTAWEHPNEMEPFGPMGIAVDLNDYVYVMDDGCECIKKFDSEGQFIRAWGEEGTGDGQFDFSSGFFPYGGIAIRGEKVYVAEAGNNRIQVFDTDGNHLNTWGYAGTWDEEFYCLNGIAVDSESRVYVSDTKGIVYMFASDSTYLGKLSGYFSGPSGIAIDNDDNVYIADRNNHQIQIFNSSGQLLNKIGSQGALPFQMDYPQGIDVSSTGSIYLADTGNNRIQVFKKVTVEDKSKAIIVTGGGSYSGNNLWDATQMSANFAYRTLTYQGFTKESIYYLSSDTDLDLDNNGEADDVDADATNANLQHALTTWASDAENLVVYLVDHGGEGTFRMSGTETLSATELDTWLDQLQAIIPGKVTVIYDACESGSFISGLTPLSGKTRTVITSTSPGESAYFVSQGSISFSNFFWTHIFNGLTIKQAFDLAAESIGQATAYQHPLLDANGNGTPNETEDFTLVETIYIGNGTEIFGEAPVIGSVSEDINISDTSSATLTATGVTDDDGIARVWAIIRPPDYSQGAADNPVQNLPSIDLMPEGEGAYSGTYDGFNIEGIYNIAIYARDRIGNTSVPKVTTVSVNNPLKRKAIIIAGGPETGDIWTAVENNASLVYEALSYQGYTDEDIYFMSPVTFSEGIDGTPASSNLEHAINTWANDNCKDLVIYMIGNGSYSEFQLNGTETLSASQLDSWLDSLQNNLPGEVTVISDADQSGGFISFLTPPAEKKRFLISGASGSQDVFFLYEGNISFSRFFWGRVLNGMNIREAFVYAKRAISYCGGQTAQLDDNGNGIPNEKQDGLLSRYYSIGTGIMLAGDDPVIGAVSPEQTINTGSSVLIWAEDITTTGTIDKVWAVITPPGSNPETATMELADNGAGRYEGTYSNLSIYGNYVVAIYAMDTEGNVSLPKDTFVFYSTGPDAYEDDDSQETANVIVIYDVGNSTPQRHNFHDTGDQDWVMFYAVQGESYDIAINNPESDCDSAIMIYDSEGNPLLDDFVDIRFAGEEESLSWPCPFDGIYYVMVKQSDPNVYGANTGYDLSVCYPTAGIPGFLMGMVVNSLGQGVGGAIIKSDISKSTAITLNSGAYIMVLPAGTHTISIAALGYPVKELAGVVITANGETSQNYIITEDLPNEPPTANAGADQTVDEGATVTLDGSGSSDPDDGIASYQWTQTSGSTVTLADATAISTTFTTPDVGPDGESLTFELVVTDNHGLQDSDTCIVNVSWQNITPVANAGDDQTVDEGTSVTLNGSGSSDPDDGIASYQWTQTSGSTVTLSNETAISPIFTAPDVGPEGDTLTFELVVTDNHELQDSDTCIVNVSWKNVAPVAYDQTINTDEDTALEVTLSASDEDGDSLTYLIVDDVAHGELTGDLPNLVYTPGTGYHGPDSFQFKVNDGSADSDIATVNINVLNLFLKGDIDDSGIVDLKDAVIAFRVFLKIDNSGIYKEADVNDDGRIGLEEVIYVLQEIVKSD